MVRRKQRTREHIIGDLGENWVERVALKAGFASQRTRPMADYGIDVAIVTVDDEEAVESGFLLFQVKATDRIEEYLLKSEPAYSFPIRMRDLRLWLGERFPVILCLYDAQREVAYWTCVQRNVSLVDADESRITKSLRFPKSNVLDIAAFQKFARWKREQLERE